MSKKKGKKKKEMEKNGWKNIINSKRGKRKKTEIKAKKVRERKMLVLKKYKKKREKKAR